MGYHVGVDIGGTFTDVIAISETNGNVHLSKVPSTRENQAIGFMNGLASADVDCAVVTWLVHGTTVGTNATLERNGAKCGLITSSGFRDLLELGRRQRPNLYGLFGKFVPLILRDCRIEVPERLDAQGRVVTPLDEQAVERAARELQAKGCESVLIGFLHSYANREPEERARTIVQRVWNTSYVTTSSEVLAEFRELERFGTAAVNAYIQPLIDRYVRRLQSELKTAGLARDVVIMQANGGIMSAEAACRRAVNTVLSGPAAGVIAARYISEQAGYRDVITCDMGGTSFDVGLIVGGEPVVTSDRDLGFNLPMRIPIIDIHTVGAGGGSIVHVDTAGMLRVGPQSAGATPGPISYGRGGTRPTITDANVLLGRLGAENLLAVDGVADVERIKRTFLGEVGERLGEADPFRVAEMALRVVNDAMATAIRAVSLQRGHDPRDFAILAFGGAGPLHGVALAQEVGVKKVIVPFLPGITCALGCLVANVRYDYVQTISKMLDLVDVADVRCILEEQAASGRKTLSDNAVPVDSVHVLHQADMQYEGQTYTVRVPLVAETISPTALAANLKDAYFERFRIDLSTFAPKLINLRTTVTGNRAPPNLLQLFEARRSAKTMESARLGQRHVFFDKTWRLTPVYERNALPTDVEIHGPAIFNQLDTTTVVEPDATATIDRFGNLVVELT